MQEKVHTQILYRLSYSFQYCDDDVGEIDVHDDESHLHVATSEMKKGKTTNSANDGDKKETNNIGKEIFIMQNIYLFITSYSDEKKALNKRIPYTKAIVARTIKLFQKLPYKIARMRVSLYDNEKMFRSHC